MENNEQFWNDYVTKWNADPKNKQFPLLGENWKGQQAFYELLKKYSNTNLNAVEIGCGGGRITNFASPLFKSIVASDISQGMIDKCREDLPQLKNVTWKKNDGFCLDFVPSESIDVVYSHDVFVHFSSLVSYAYLTHICRVLKVGGIGLVSFNNFVSHFHKFKGQAIRYNNQKILPPSMRHHFMTQEMLETMLKDLNFEIVEINTSNFLIGVFRKK